MFGRVARSANEISAENCIDPADHLKVILAVTAVPLPSRRPKEAKRVDGEEDCANCNQSNLQEFSRMMSSILTSCLLLDLLIEIWRGTMSE